MKPSNVQTKSVTFLGVQVEPNKAYNTENEDPSEFDWSGVNIGIVSKLKKNSDTEYVVFLRIAIDNDDGKPSPYSVDVSVVGRFEFIGEEDPIKREDLVVVNGLSILYGTIREMVTMISSRMPFAEICLPGANFIDHRPSAKKAKKTAKALDQSPAPKKRAARKKPTSDK